MISILQRNWWTPSLRAQNLSIIAQVATERKVSKFMKGSKKGWIYYLPDVWMCDVLLRNNTSTTHPMRIKSMCALYTVDQRATGEGVNFGYREWIRQIVDCFLIAISNGRAHLMTERCIMSWQQRNECRRICWNSTHAQPFICWMFCYWLPWTFGQTTTTQYTHSHHRTARWQQRQRRKRGRRRSLCTCFVHKTSPYTFSSHTQAHVFLTILKF